MTKKILLVDDERSIRESLCKVLRAEGYEVVCAENGEEAIGKFGQERMDLLLLDIGMPVKDGWGTLAWLAGVNPFLPVVIITGRWRQSELAEKAGADALMEKPLDVPRLLQTIRELVDEPAESRAQRIRRHERSFRHVSCGHEEFLEMLRVQFTTPYPCPKKENH